ncbi:hypothetical protein K458DRAFT_394208 [Lentithecium fluviatile CBS 122367]|uniref:Uncharacterized protein n=1 Tax=Lentithecium fluviatile CBS 122367 TaxID=1168545 RepID=A0A6G1ILE1_9PLEO|nr:hypothetical protein K458DRAFT_394208 [Lentithecium fluviatile CBS 122367]
MEPRDAVRRRIFVADLGLKVEISAGVIQKVMYDQTSRSLLWAIAPLITAEGLRAKSSVVWLKELALPTSKFRVARSKQSRGGWLINLLYGKTTVEILET